MSEFSINYSDSVKSRIGELLGGRLVRLASGSPRRRQILTKLGVEFEQCTPEGEEDFRTDLPGDDPVAESIEVTRHKAAQGVIGAREGIVVAADTIVVLDGTVLPKPADRNEARSHLARLAGRDHHVHTSLVIRDVDRGVEASGTASSRVTFRRVTSDEIGEYVATGEPDDKAGAYGIQGMGKFLVDKFTGNLDNIIGFPALLFIELLEELNRQ
jgi:septum formation protein